MTLSEPGLLDSIDWAKTPLGPRSEWPQRLEDVVAVIMPARMPMMLWWGKELIQIYNEAYARLSGNKHPSAFGRPAQEVWTEAWDDLGPIADRVLNHAEPSFAEGRLLLIDRHGYLEETYWTSSYSPICGDENDVLGVLVASTDVTANVVGARRLETVRQLGTLSSANEGGLEQTCQAAIRVLGANRQAVPFATMHIIEDGRARLAAGYGIAVGNPLNPAREFDLDDAPDLAGAVRTRSRVLVSGLRQQIGASGLEPGPLGDELPEAAMLLPVGVPGGPGPVAVATLGVNPYREVDDAYLAFFQLVARQLQVAVGDAVAYQAERQRSRELAELDEDKTRFFQNVGHELRTPVTLVLGPLRSVLEDASVLPFQHRQDLRSAHRAALRLRKLVDNMFQFSRAQSQQLETFPESVDLAALTAELAAMFRPVAKDADLDLRVDVSLVTEPVETDREMWSEIVLNLLSNAIKFTPPGGGIEVILRPEFDTVVLDVRDSGVGIPAELLPHVFERFAQVPGQSGRSAEGAGIGLALVRSLTQALGGEVSVSSEVGKGSTFTVAIPASAPSGSMEVAPPARLERWTPSPYLAEAETWVADDAAETQAAAGISLGRLLLVEDNTDMRGYLRRLLSDDGWTVIDVPTVEAALAVHPPPDIVVSDIMLPGRSGLDLVRLIRSDEATRRTPVLLLTARYGSDAAAEGLAAGADDYVVKPFDPTELLARIRTHYELFQLREFALSAAEDKAANLQKALTSNRQIGVAMGVLMARENLTEDQAFARLRSVSQNNNRKLRDVAEQVILTGTLD